MPDCSQFFRFYRVPIKNSPYLKIPQHLRNLMNQIFTIITDEFDYSNEQFDPVNAKITVDKQTQTLEIVLTDTNERYFVVNDGGNWKLFEEEMFIQLFGDDEEDGEDVWIPSPTP